MPLLDRIVKKIFERRGIDYALTKRTVRSLSANVKSLASTLDEFLYDKVFRKHTFKTAVAAACEYSTDYHTLITDQWKKVKRDWGYVRSVLKNGDWNRDRNKDKSGVNTMTRTVMTHASGIASPVTPQSIFSPHKTIDEYLGSPVSQEKQSPGKQSLGKQASGTYSLDYLTTLITDVQKYRGKSLTRVAQYIGKTHALQDDLSTILQVASQYKTCEPSYARLPQIRFHRDLVSDEMRTYLVKGYVESGKSLRELSANFEQQYGIHIAEATFSKYAREYLSFAQQKPIQSRRAAQKEYRILHAAA